MRTCDRCGAALSADARFCPSCGAPANAAPLGTERKLVTVLFADVTDSTSIAERLDPESLKDVLDAFFATMRGEIEAEGGTVEKFIGDAVVAVFGVPAAHEDDATRALRAASRMQAALANLNTELDARHGLSLQVRIGVNTGEVIAAVAPGPGEALVAGDAVNVAARLEQAAAPGQVLVSKRTARASRGARFSEIGSLSLKGKTQAVVAVQLLDVAADTGREILFQAPMVGRRREMALLETLYQRVASEGRPHLVTVFGDPGVGKSRLVEEFRSRASELEAPPHSVQGRCLPYGQGLTYWPMAEILKRHAGVLDSDSSSVALSKITQACGALLTPNVTTERERAIAALCFTVGLGLPGGPFEEMEPRQINREISEAWRSFFTALARRSPTLVVIEDLHWADPVVLSMLEELVDGAEGPLLFLCPSRPDLATRRPNWGGGARNGSSLVLEPLSDAEAGELLELLARAEDVPAELRARILDRAGGNPLFLEEIIRHLLLDRTQADATEPLASGLDVDIPDTVQALLAARMDLLDPADKKVLQSAAVVGRVFWSGPVARLLNGEAEQVREACRRLEERGLVHARPGSSMEGEREFAFNHVLTRDVAYESLPRRDRAAAHARVAGWIEERAGQRGREFAELLAHHYREAFTGATNDPAHDPDTAEALRQKAFRYSLLASEELRGRFVLGSAERYADAALALAPGPVERSRALAVLGNAYFLDSKGDRAWQCLREAVDLRASGAPEDHRGIAGLAAQALEIPARGPGTMRARLSRAETQPLLAIGLGHAGDTDSEELLRLLVAQSFLPGTFREQDATEEEWAGAREAGEHAAKMALRLGRPDLASAALEGVAQEYLDAGLWGLVEPSVGRRLELTDALSDPWELGDIFASAAWAALFVGRYEEARSHADRGYREARSAAPLLALYCLDWRAWANFCLGDWEGFFYDVDMARGLLGDRWENPPAFAADPVAVAAFIHEVRGERAEADRKLDVLAWLEEAEERLAPSWVVFRSLVYARRDLFAEAHAVLDGFDHGPRHYGRGLLLQARCEVLGAEEAWKEVPALLEESRRHAEHAGLLALPVYADRLEGAMALSTGESREATRLLAAAHRGFKRLGAVWEEARTQLPLSESLVRAGDLDAAREHVSHAETVFERMGSFRELNRAREIRQRTG